MIITRKGAATWSGQPVVLHHIGRLLTDHVDRCIRVTGHDSRHDGRIDDAQSADAVHLQLGIDDSRRIAGRSHFAGARLMLQTGRVPPDAALPIGVTFEREVFAARKRGCMHCGVELLEALRFGQFDALAM